jgi:hypothetical protein
MPLVAQLAPHALARADCCEGAQATKRDCKLRNTEGGDGARSRRPKASRGYALSSSGVGGWGSRKILSAASLRASARIASGSGDAR